MDQHQLDWRERKSHLRAALNLNTDDEDTEGRALDSHFLQREGQRPSEKSTSIDKLRFTNRDLSNLGALAHGPFGIVEMVRCRLNNKLYVRKTVEKRVVARNPNQCYPLHERDLLVAATLSRSHWAPHLLCTFQTPLSLCYVMDFAEGGSLSDLLESVGQLPERDLQWWLPQMISAIGWCHSQGFCHRDVKPSNFVLTPKGHLLIIDFASSARLLLPDKEGVQKVPISSCLVLCGTCDYISPEILQMQEEALIALEGENESFIPKEEGGYGKETDWWSLGAMVYELVYGVAPFFAKDVRKTYDRIINHESALRFPMDASVSAGCVRFLKGLLCPPSQRLGRLGFHQFEQHAYFKNVEWSSLHKLSGPTWLKLPEFEYDLPAHSIADIDDDETFSKGFAFSAFFNSSASSSNQGSNHGKNSSSHEEHVSNQLMASNPQMARYLGFSWGPKANAFDNVTNNPIPINIAPITTTTQNRLPLPTATNLFVTPVRPSLHLHAPPPSTIRRTVGGTARNSAATRAVSEMEALKQMGDCIRASARKRVQGSEVPARSAPSQPLRRRASDVRIALDFESVKAKGRADQNVESEESRERSSGLRIFIKDRPTGRGSSLGMMQPDDGSSGGYRVSGPGSGLDIEEDDFTSDEDPPSPSPRPGSALSSKRGSTPSIFSSLPSRSGSLPLIANKVLSKKTGPSPLFTLFRTPSSLFTNGQEKQSVTPPTTHPEPLGGESTVKPKSRLSVVNMDSRSTPRVAKRLSTSDFDAIVVPPIPNFDLLRDKEPSLLILPEQKYEPSPREFEKHATKVSYDSHFDEMEIRLQKMMEDIQLVEHGISSARSKVVSS